MNYYPLYHYFIYNGEIKPNVEFRVSENVGGVYEVIRVSFGIPLFLEEHLERFYFSASLAGKRILYGKDQIAGFIAQLIVKNRISEGNILLSCKMNLKAFFIPHHYPVDTFYETGITCGLLKAERLNPNAKVFQTTVRQQADELMEKEGLYEVLLVDFHDRVTEGSRSNVFFTRTGVLYTPPGKEVLLGITRQKVIRLAGDAGIPLREQEIFRNDLGSFQAAFITGTSPRVLPVSHIDAFKFDPRDDLVQLLRQKYDALIAEYIRGKRGSTFSGL